MSKLSILTLVIGAAMVLLHLPIVLWPARVRQWLIAFPRSVWPGRILSAIGLAWAGWLLKDMPMGPLDPYRKYLIVATPVTIGLTWFYLDELLGPRALGGLLLLIPTPWLQAARLHPSSWTIVVSVVSYIMIFKGIALVLSPYTFRKGMECIGRSERMYRVAGAVGVALDLFLILLALTVYR